MSGLNREKFFSATEVSKFCYCKMQWYYERVYGAKQLNEWRKERNEAMGWDAGGAEDAFAKGRRFHEGYVGKDHLKKVLVRILFALVVIAAAYFILNRR